MKSTRESVRAPTSQRRNPSRSPCTCSESPLLSCSARRSLNDLQISLNFQGPKPFRVLPGRMAGLFRSRSLPLLCLLYPPVDHRWSRKQQKRRACVAKVTDFHSCCDSDVIRQVSCYVVLIMQLHTHTHTHTTFYPFITPFLSNKSSCHTSSFQGVHMMLHVAF